MNFLRSIRRIAETLAQKRKAAQWRSRHLSPSARLARSVQVYGWSHVRIGARTVVCDDTLINALNWPQEEPSIVIGEACFIGRRNFFSAGTLIEIGDFCLTGQECNFLGSDHVMDAPETPYLAAGTTPGGVIRIGINCWLGTRVTVLKGVTIGFGAVIGAASVVTKDIPPLSVAAGNPARVMKRFDLGARRWVPVAEFCAKAEALIPSQEEFARQVRANGNFRLPVAAMSRDLGDF